MHVIVLGAGVVGISTAYYLHRAGYAVTVVERHSAPAEEASLGNAGGICPGFSGPWASPGLLQKAPSWLLRRNAPLSFGRGLGLADAGWLKQFITQCESRVFRENKTRMQRVAHYSRACFSILNAELGWAENYDFQASGVLQLFREKGDLHNAEDRAVPVLQRNGIDHRLVDRTGLSEIEPALRASASDFLGGLYLPGDAAGDSHKFAGQLADWLRERGVVFHYGTAITGLESDGTRLGGVHTDLAGKLEADAYVVALGSDSPALLKPLGLKLPIRPVKGYSLTAPLRDPDKAPTVSVMDETHKTMITRLGDRLRIAGMAEISGFDVRLPETRKAFFEKQLESVYPGAADFSAAQFWAGLRPMTPDGPPILGKTPLAGLYLNTGHGSSGWTQACGTGKVLADLISGASPDIDLEGLTLNRYLS